MLSIYEAPAARRHGDVVNWSTVSMKKLSLNSACRMLQCTLLFLVDCHSDPTFIEPARAVANNLKNDTVPSFVFIG